LISFTFPKFRKRERIDFVTLSEISEDADVVDFVIFSENSEKPPVLKISTPLPPLLLHRQVPVVIALIIPVDAVDG